MRKSALFVRLRAKGGRVNHIVTPGVGHALCGFRPLSALLKRNVPAVSRLWHEGWETPLAGPGVRCKACDRVLAEIPGIGSNT